MTALPIALPRIARVVATALLAVFTTVAHATLPIESWTLPNGARVLFVENRALPMLDVSVDFPAGFSRDLKDSSGLASMTLGMLRLGAGGATETQIAGRLADVGAQLGTRFDADRAGYSLRSVSSERELEEGLSVLADVLQKPAFPKEVLDREKARLSAALKEAGTKPESIAERAFYTAVYRGHPYGLRGSGEIATVSTFQPGDLEQFYRTWYRSDWAVVAVMGDVSHDQADAIARRMTDGLPRADGRAKPLPSVASLEAAVMKSIDHPASQSHILMGQPGIRRDDPDYFPLFVGNYVLGGGGFASRMVEEVRQKRGLAYSAYSYFSPLAEQGVFQIGLQTKKEQAAQALEVVRDTVRRYVEDGPTAQELEAAKQNLVGGFPLRIDSNRKIHDYLAVIGFYHLPLDYLDQFVQRIEAVTADQVREAFRRRVHPDRMVTVVVGGAPQPK
ncbi:MAG: pitrilysin family protein [Burkholderiales bacterium]